jgi:branched-chain amino acid transport system ATP-binding protein
MLLKIEDLKVRYGKVEAVKGVSLGVQEGSIVTLIGANGAGKTTLLKTLSGLIRPYAGEILFHGNRIDRWRPARIVKAGIAQVPEGGRIFSKLTVGENLKAGTYLRRDQEKIDRDYGRVFKHFPVLRERTKQKAGTMSGGERQMLAFGRALMNGPKLMLLDEPSLGLSPILVQTIFDIIRAINQEGVTILLVEQNARMAIEVADYVYVLETGKVILYGPSRELKESPQVKEAYLGG